MATAKTVTTASKATVDYSQLLAPVEDGIPADVRELVEGVVSALKNQPEGSCIRPALLMKHLGKDDKKTLGHITTLLNQMVADGTLESKKGAMGGWFLAGHRPMNKTLTAAEKAAAKLAKTQPRAEQGSKRTA